MKTPIGVLEGVRDDLVSAFTDVEAAITALKEADMPTLEFRRFSNALRILRSLDAHEVESIAAWPRFRDNPYMYFITCSDEDKRTIWRAIERRQPISLQIREQRDANQG